MKWIYDESCNCKCVLRLCTEFAGFELWCAGYWGKKKTTQNPLVLVLVSSTESFLHPRVLERVECLGVTL